METLRDRIAALSDCDGVTLMDSLRFSIRDLNLGVVRQRSDFDEFFSLPENLMELILMAARICWRSESGISRIRDIVRVLLELTPELSRARWSGYAPCRNCLTV